MCNQGVAFVLDLTERKRAEAEVRESEQVKASVFSRRQTCRGKSQAPRSSDSRVAGKGAGGGEERAGQARATMHAPFKRQVERKVALGEGLFSLRLPKFESYQPGILNSLPPCCSTLAPPQCQRNPCRSCTLATPQLGRELPLLRHFGQIGTNSPGNAGGF